MIDIKAEPAISIHRMHLIPKTEPWCREILAYSPNNPGDSPEKRANLYTADAIRAAVLAERERHSEILQQARAALQKTMAAWGGTCAWHADVKAAIAAIDAAAAIRKEPT